MRVQFVLQEIWIGLRRNLTMTISLVITVAIAMALFGTGLLIKAQVDNSKSYWDGKIQVSIFLCLKGSPTQTCNATAATPADRQALMDTLHRIPNVMSVEYEDQAHALARFKEEYANNPAFANSTQIGDIPDSLRVKLRDPSKFDEVRTAVSGAKGVDQIINEADILKKFFRILDGLEWAALLIALLQMFAAIMLVANTVRLSAFNRRRETGIMRLVGASNLYIQLPFILEGAIAGLVGGLVSTIMLIGAKLFLIDKLQGQVQFATQLGWGSTVMIIIFSICIGVLLCAGSSFLTLRRYLRI
jgi:cell division transport system permease protein